ncbi:MAG: cyclic pyranopterin phosphate synthase [Verrucomicrobiales bacterium]
MQDPYGHRISYLRVSITDRCNERCRYCMPQELQEWLPRDGILTYEEILRVVRVGVELGVKKVRVTGGEPLVRRDAIPFLQQLCAIDGIDEVGISTNGTLLAKPDPDAAGESGEKVTMAQRLVEAGVRTCNVSLDSLNRETYAQNTGRDFLPRVLAGLQAAHDAGFSSVKINAVLMKNQNEHELPQLVDFAHEKGLLLRFIELMPVSTREMLNDNNFLATGTAKKLLEAHYGTLTADPDFRTNGPASYFRIPGRDQRIGFIGAMTNLHFCENCNKLRLTCDGKLRPCLGSFLEFDLLKVLREGADDATLKQFFLDVVERKPKEHDFRNNYQPNRRMVAIGG